jgi:hypothetical protein
MLVYGLVVISGIDNVIAAAAARDPDPSLLGFPLGGVLAFGPLGFLVGPVVLS